MVATVQMDVAGHGKALDEADNPEAFREPPELAKLVEELTDDFAELAELAEDLAEIAEQAVGATRTGARRGKFRLVRRNSREDKD